MPSAGYLGLRAVLAAGVVALLAARDIGHSATAEAVLAPGVVARPATLAFRSHTDLLAPAARWTDRMNDARVSDAPHGVRIEVAPGKDWAIARLPLPPLAREADRFRVVAHTEGRAAVGFVNLVGGRARGGFPILASLFYGRQSSNTLAEPDPRLRPVAPDSDRPSSAPGSPLALEAGLQGAPGDALLLERVEVAPGPKRPVPIRIPGQKSIPAVDLMPDLPQPLRILDWRGKAWAYDRFAFDLNRKGRYLPLAWIDRSRINMDYPTFGLCSYVGDHRQGGVHQEGVTCLGAVLGGTLAGIDKRRQAHDYVRMGEAFYNAHNGSHLVLNDQDAGTGGSFWYEIWPHLVFYALADRYPGHGRLDAIMRETASRWADAVAAMRPKAGGPPVFDHTAFDFHRMRPVDNGRWTEPDAAAGIGWLEYAAWRRFHDPRFLRAADDCLAALQHRARNPYYEVLLPWGTLAAFRMNAEAGRRYDTDKLLSWCFGLSRSRPGWGVVVQRWGAYDCAGLVGSVSDGGGYAFAMNSFAQAGALVPVARYDPRYARAIGKWMLNLANAARLFYPNSLPEAHRSPPYWAEDRHGVVAYEGLRREWQGKSPCATGDPVAMHWGPETDLGLYGSSYVGFLGAIVRPTNVPGILQLDCRATDFFHDRAFPTYLYYNPYPTARTVVVPVGARAHGLYDSVTGRWVVCRVRGRAHLRLAGGRAAVVTVVPAPYRLTAGPHALRANGIIIDYRRGHTAAAGQAVSL